MRPAQRASAGFASCLPAYAAEVATTPRGFGVLQIEPTDHCNLACRMCAPHAESWPTVHGVPKGYMQLGMFRNIVDRLVAEDCTFDHLILQWLGDPSLHPELEHMLAYAAEKLAGRIGYLRFDTNAVVLTPPRVDAIISVGRFGVPLLVVFTIDAASEATYLRVKGRDALGRVRRHVRHLLARRSPAGRVNVQVQFVVQPGNAHEAAAFLAYWRRQFECYGSAGGHSEIMFKRLSVSGGAAGQARADAQYEKTLREAEITPYESDVFSVTTWSDRPWQADDAHADRTACPGLWYTPVVRQDGELLMCCADLHSELHLGNVAEAGFRALWWGEKAASVRLDHLSGKFSGVCAACGGVNWYALPDNAGVEAREHARQLGLSA